MLHDTVTVYIRKSDGAEGDIYSEHDAMDEYDDMINETNPVVTVCGADYDPARMLKMADSVAYRCGFLDYANGEFHELEMPWELFVSDDDEARAAWVKEQLDQL